jgi:hypothetical protein
MVEHHARLALASSALAIALAACGPKPNANTAAAAAAAPAANEAGAPAEPAPDLAADAAAAAQTPKDQPNFRVCLASSLADAAPLTVPAGVIFESWGRKKGDERNPSLDPNMLAPDAIRYVVILDRPMSLSKATPCAETVAQAVVTPIYDWKMPLVRHSQDLQFGVAGVENHMAFPLTDRLGDLVKKDLIYGFPTADIGNPRLLKNDED